MFLLVLILLRESTGDTFFRHYEEASTLSCSKAADKDRFVWCGGESYSSLLEFELMKCDENGEPIQPNRKERKKQECTKRNLSIATFPAGGIFACKLLTEPLIDDERKCPVFNDQDDCSTYDFFIIAKIINDQVTSEKTSKALESLSLVVDEKDNFTLPCEFDADLDYSFAMYWIKVTDSSTCIFSDAYEDHDFSPDKNCCIDATVKPRRVYNSTDSRDQHQRRNITICNAVPSDSGSYLCVLAARSKWSKKQYKWEIKSNVSVEVKGAMWTTFAPADEEGFTEPSEALKNGLLISGGVLGGIVLIVLIGGIAYFLFQKKKSRGRPSELHHERTHSTAELQEMECSPYAVSSGNDIGRIEGVYSLAGSPGIHLTGASSLPYDKTASEVQPGGNVQAIYAKVNKQR